MPKIIAISGEIGWDVWPEEIRAQIAEAKDDEPLQFDISSPGGYIYDGLEIFNMIRNYPGPTTTHAVGMAASMASYLLMAGDTKKAASNAIFMIHNARGYTGGDHLLHRKRANVLEGMSKLLGQEYVAQTGKSKEEIAKLMDDETYLFGNEILAAGFVDEIVNIESEEKDAAAKDDLILNAMMKVDAVTEKIKSKPEDLLKIAALLPTDPPKPAKAPVKPNPSQGKTMNEEQFLAFLETNPEAKAFYTDGMAYIKAVADSAPDIKALGLTDFLALSPVAKADHETALTEARATVESGRVTEEVINKVSNIIASPDYDESVKAVGVKVLVGKKDYSDFEDMVAMEDRITERFKSLQNDDEQPPNTPGHQASAQQAAQQKTKDSATALSAAINNSENKVQ
jgi:ATP-dependent Clp endopeptidase proteolytic subunit ClpP